jgi:hypothetical protein
MDVALFRVTTDSIARGYDAARDLDNRYCDMTRVFQVVERVVLVHCSEARDITLELGT